MHRLLTLSLLLLCTACSQRSVLSQNGITVQEVTHIPGLPTANGYWEARTLTISLVPGRGHQWVLQHEVAHAADTLGSYREAIRLLGRVPGYERQVAECYELAALADKLGGKPIHYWQAMEQRYGMASVEHPEIKAKLGDLMKWRKP